VRIARQPVRYALAHVTAGDVAKTNADLADFQKGWPKAEALIKIRSTQAVQEINDALAAATRGIAANTSAAQLQPLVNNLNVRYGYGVNLVNGAARSTDTAKTTFTNEDVATAAKIEGIQAVLVAAQASWDKGDFAAAGQQAMRAAGPLFDVVLPALKARGGDIAFKAALDNYVKVAGATGDAVAVKNLNKLAVEAGAAAEQFMVGHFWTDPKLRPAIDAAPKQWG